MYIGGIFQGFSQCLCAFHFAYLPVCADPACDMRGARFQSSLSQPVHARRGTVLSVLWPGFLSLVCGPLQGANFSCRVCVASLPFRNWVWHFQGYAMPSVTTDLCNLHLRLPVWLSRQSLCDVGYPSPGAVTGAHMLLPSLACWLRPLTGRLCVPVCARDLIVPETCKYQGAAFGCCVDSCAGRTCSLWLQSSLHSNPLLAPLASAFDLWLACVNAFSWVFFGARCSTPLRLFSVFGSSLSQLARWRLSIVHGPLRAPCLAEADLGSVMALVGAWLWRSLVGAEHGAVGVLLSCGACATAGLIALLFRAWPVKGGRCNMDPALRFVRSLLGPCFCMWICADFASPAAAAAGGPFVGPMLTHPVPCVDQAVSVGNDLFKSGNEHVGPPEHGVSFAFRSWQGLVFCNARAFGLAQCKRERRGPFVSRLLMEPASWLLASTAGIVCALLHIIGFARPRPLWACCWCLLVLAQCCSAAPSPGILADSASVLGTSLSDMDAPRLPSRIFLRQGFAAHFSEHGLEHLGHEETWHT